MEEKIYTIKTDRDEILRYLGFTENMRDAAVRTAGDAADSDKTSAEITDSYASSDRTFNAPDALEQQIGRCEKLLIDAARPRYTYRIFRIDRSCGRLMLEGTSVEITGNDAAALLAECGSCIVMAATIGQAADMLIRRTQISSMADAVIMDSCASSAVESICSQLNDDLRLEFENRGLFLTDRYSPGYGDMPLSLQPQLCGLLRTEKLIGLSVSPGLTLIPSKSVTAIIGISDRPQKMRDISCESCRLKDTCKLRKAGQTCGKRER